MSDQPYRTAEPLPPPVNQEVINYDSNSTRPWSINKEHETLKDVLACARAKNDGDYFLQYRLTGKGIVLIAASLLAIANQLAKLTDAFQRKTF